MTDDYGLPTMVLEPWLEAHVDTRSARHAHPIDGRIVTHVAEENDTIVPLVDTELSLFQATALAYIHPNEDVYEEYRETIDGVAYYVARSPAFYDVFVRAQEMWEQSVPISRAELVANAHTMQYLVDVHDVERETALNSHLDKLAYGNPFLEDEHYGHVDHYGLVIEEGTHELGDEQESETVKWLPVKG